MTDKEIWDFIYSRIHNAYGTAAIMGNIMAESSMNPRKCTKASVKSDDYISMADKGEIDFAYDGVAFGFVQWCYWSRKLGLLSYAESKGTSIADPTTQLEYMIDEMGKYKTVMEAVKNASNVRDASDIVMLKYEKPANISESAKSKRESYGNKYFDTFAGSAEKEEGTDKTAKAVVANVNVNIRNGNGKSFSRLGAITAGTILPYVAESDNGWYAVRYKNQVAWVSGEFTSITFV